jgi:hypothetical protein
MAVMTTATIIDQFRITRIITRWDIDSHGKVLVPPAQTNFPLIDKMDPENNVQDRIEEEDEDDEADVDNLDQAGLGGTDNVATSTNNGRQKKKKNKKSKNR